MIDRVRHRSICPDISIAPKWDTHPQRSEVNLLSVAAIDLQRIGMKMLINRPVATAFSGKKDCQYRNRHYQVMTRGTFSHFNGSSNW